MSLLDKALAAVTPEETAQERAEARNRAPELARTAPWLDTVLQHHEEIEAATAFEEQSEAKVHLAKLESLDPMSPAYLDKLQRVDNAVTHRVYQEESDWFPELARADDASMQARLATRYAEEFDRYMGVDAGRGPAFVSMS